jgi:hypothetical protein
LVHHQDQRPGGRAACPGKAAPRWLGIIMVAGGCSCSSASGRRCALECRNTLLAKKPVLKIEAKGHCHLVTVAGTLAGSAPGSILITLILYMLHGPP